jgi:hypothetical protein
MRENPDWAKSKFLNRPAAETEPAPSRVGRDSDPPVLSRYVGVQYNLPYWPPGFDKGLSRAHKDLLKELTGAGKAHHKIIDVTAKRGSASPFIQGSYELHASSDLSGPVSGPEDVAWLNARLKSRRVQIKDGIPRHWGSVRLIGEDSCALPTVAGSRSSRLPLKVHPLPPLDLDLTADRAQLETMRFEIAATAGRPTPMLAERLGWWRVDRLTRPQAVPARLDLFDFFRLLRGPPIVCRAEPAPLEPMHVYPPYTTLRRLNKEIEIAKAKASAEPLVEDALTNLWHRKRRKRRPPRHVYIESWVDHPHGAHGDFMTVKTGRGLIEQTLVSGVVYGKSQSLEDKGAIARSLWPNGFPKEVKKTRKRHWPPPWWIPGDLDATWSRYLGSWESVMAKDALSGRKRSFEEYKGLVHWEMITNPGASISAIARSLGIDRTEVRRANKQAACRFGKAQAKAKAKTKNEPDAAKRAAAIARFNNFLRHATAEYRFEPIGVVWQIWDVELEEQFWDENQSPTPTRSFSHDYHEAAIARFARFNCYLRHSQGRGDPRSPAPTQSFSLDYLVQQHGCNRWRPIVAPEIELERDPERDPEWVLTGRVRLRIVVPIATMLTRTMVRPFRRRRH